MKNVAWKEASWGFVIGAVLIMIVGFSWMGWVLGSTAEKMAVDRADTAVAVALTPFCVQNFMKQPDAAVKAEELRKIDSWKRREVVEKGGWAIMPGSKESNSRVLDPCVEEILKAKK